MLGKAWVCATEYEENTPSSTILKEDLLKKILESRGVRSGVDTSKFLNPSIKEYMPDPSVLADMDSAARIIVDNIVAGRKIAIYGDYDVDGITSSAIMVKYLRAVGANVVWHLPTREGEGYGLNCDAVSAIAADGVNLIVTVDCGISGVEEIALAKKLGLDVVVTDHHSPDGNLPAADAVVNPKRLDDTSGMSYLAGVGVAFMTLVAVNRELKSRNDDKFQIPHSLFLIDLMDLVALGTICDTMPLVGLNRAFAATGLKVLAKRNNVGLRALMDIAVIK